MSEDEANTVIRHRAAWIGAAAVIAAAVIGGVFLMLDRDPSGGRDRVSARGGQSRNEDACVGGGAVVQGDVHCTRNLPREDSRIRPTTAEAGCGLVRHAKGGESFRLRVIMWCAPKSVRGLYEYVLKVAVDNKGNIPLDISADHFLLVWRTLRGRWTPPPGGAYGEPRQVRYLGRDYWGIPANFLGTAEYRPDGALTFATEWDYETLSPGASSLRLTRDSARIRYAEGSAIKTIRYNRDEDDLVFYVPEPTVNRDLNLLGLAYVRGDRVIALCPQSQWGPRLAPAYF